MRCCGLVAGSLSPAPGEGPAPPPYLAGAAQYYDLGLMPPHEAGGGGTGDRVPVGRSGGLPGRRGVVPALGTQELPQRTPPAMGIGASRRQPQVPRQDTAAGYPPRQIQPHDQVSALKPHGGTPHEDALDDPPRAARAHSCAGTTVKFSQVKPQGAGHLTAQGSLPGPAAADNVDALRPGQPAVPHRASKPVITVFHRHDPVRGRDSIP